VPLYTEIYLSHFKVRGKSQKDFLNTLENLAIQDPQSILKPILKPLIMDIIQIMYKLDILNNFDCDHSDFLQKAARVGGGVQLDPQDPNIGFSRVGLALRVQNSGRIGSDWIGSGWPGLFGKTKHTPKVKNVHKSIPTLTLDENSQRSKLQRADEPKPKKPTFEGCSFVF
jgi:hypothetical protein